MSTELITMTDIEKMGLAIAKSGLFGMKTPEQAIALMCIAQAEGLHPAIAARDYHIIQGRPALKADAMLARFQKAGGAVEWHDYTDMKVSATFSHSSGGSVKVEWDLQRAKTADLGSNGMWKKYPRQMLRARVISEGIRTVYPGVNAGFYTREEEEDIAIEKKKNTHREPEYEVLNPSDIKIIDEPKQEEPQKPQEPENSNLEKVVGVIEKIEIKEGEKNGKPWKKYGVTIDNIIYGTFAESIGSAASVLEGKAVELWFSTNGKYKTIEELKETDLPF